MYRGVPTNEVSKSLLKLATVLANPKSKILLIFYKNYLLVYISHLKLKYYLV
mgnify:CR=1 FL=1